MKTELASSVHNTNDLKKLFDWTPDQITEKTNEYIKHAEKTIEGIIRISHEQRTFENTAQALDSLVSLSDLSIAMNIFSALEITSPDEAIRNVCHESSLVIQNFFIDFLSNNKLLYNAFKAYVDGNMAKEVLTAPQCYFIEETMNDFKRAGLNLPDDQLEKIKKLKKELSALALTFERNIAQDDSSITVDQAGLKGLEADFIENLKRTDGGLYILGVDYPTFFNVLENCVIEDTRKRLMQAFANRAYPQNETIIKDIITKRDQLARMLGFASYAEYDLAEQMVKTPERADSFLKDLFARSQQKEQKEIKEWTRELPESVTLTKEGKIKGWDFSFIKASYKKKHFNIDEREIAQYFPMEKTIEGLLDIYRQFLSIDFVEIPIDGIWHDDVKLIQVLTSQDAVFLGYLFLDLYPRPNKYSHAAHTTVIPAGFDADNNSRVAVSIVLANFPKPTQGKSALLKRSDVNTFFHEFGHALHALLGATHLASQAGTSVKRDFVELPSQMLEEWLWDKEMLKKVSSHYKTGKPLSDDLIDNIIGLKLFDTGTFVQQQSFYAQASLAYFLQGTQKDPYAIWQELFAKMRPNIASDPEGHSYASFGHLTGYGAKYYGYLWSKVFALDMFVEIKKHGLLNPEIGQKYVREVIGKGGSQDPNELLRNFLGREPNSKAFFTELGLD